MSGDKIIAGLTEARNREALRDALRDYDTAQLGRLNLTAEALRKAATLCGWTWNDRPLRAWVCRYLGLEQAK